MQHLPIFLDVESKPTLVAGGGIVAARRTELLLRAGAPVLVCAPVLCPDFAEVRTHPRFRHLARHPAIADLQGVFLCFIATQDAELNAVARAMARQAGVLVNVADSVEASDFILPSIVDRSPVVIAVSTAGASPILGRMLKARLESLIPAAYGRLAGLVSRFREKLVTMLPDPDARRRFWEGVLEGPTAELVLAGDDAAAEASLQAEIRLLGAGVAGARRGEVFLVGAGPGDPDLLTFRAFRLMQKADVVLYDRLTDESIMKLVRREAQRIYVGKRPDDHTLPQEDISALLVRLAKEGKRVLRLKGGDPFIFGRGGEEIETLAENEIPFQVCPGITAAGGCAAYAGIPLTHRDHAQVCLFVTGHGKNGALDLDWGALLLPHQTVAIYMGLRHIEELTAEFITRGAHPELPAAVIDNGTRVNQRVVTGTLHTLAAKVREAGLRGPSIIIIGTVVTLRDKLNWYAPAQRPAESAESGAAVKPITDKHREVASSIGPSLFPGAAE